MRQSTLSELPEDAKRITDTIYAVIGRDFDWRVYEEVRSGWRLIDVKPTLRAVRQQYAPDDFEPNPPPSLYRAIVVDGSGQRHPIGSGPLPAMRERAMATWLGDPTVKSAYVLDRIGHSHLTLEPRDRPRLMAANPYRVASDYDRDWVVVARHYTPKGALNTMIERQVRYPARLHGKIESVESRSRPGRFSYAVSVKPVDGRKESLDFLESQYVKNPGRLSAASRKKLPARVFVFPRRRAWPIESEEAAHDAIQHLRMGHVKSASEYLAIMNFIRTRFPRVWKRHGHGLSWAKSKTAKAKARTSRRKHAKRTSRRRTSKAA